MKERIYWCRLRRSFLYIGLALTVLLTGCQKQSGDDKETFADLQEETFSLTVYRYGDYIEEDVARIGPTLFKIYHGDQLLGTYPYLKLSSCLIALYDEEAQTYVICSYILSEDGGMALDILGAAAQDMAGEWDARYTDQGSTAKLDLMPEGLGKEYDQLDSAGRRTGEMTSFFYCLRGQGEERKLFILTNTGYFIYKFHADREAKSLSLTIEGQESYSWDEP